MGFRSKIRVQIRIDKGIILVRIWEGRSDATTVMKIAKVSTRDGLGSAGRQNAYWVVSIPTTEGGGGVVRQPGLVLRNTFSNEQTHMGRK